MPVSYLTRLEDLQKRLKDKCHIKIGHEPYFGFYASVETEKNEYPYWIKYNGRTLREAIRKLLEFFDGKREDHAVRKREPKDFLS